MNYIQYDETNISVRVMHALTHKISEFDITNHVEYGQSFWTFGNDPLEGMRNFLKAAMPFDKPEHRPIARRLADNMNGKVKPHGIILGTVMLFDLISFLKFVDKTMTEIYGVPKMRFDEKRDKPHRLAGHVRLEFE